VQVILRHTLNEFPSVFQFHVDFCVSVACLPDCIIIPEQVQYWLPFGHSVDDHCLSASPSYRCCRLSLAGDRDWFYSTSCSEIQSEVVSSFNPFPGATVIISIFYRFITNLHKNRPKINKAITSSVTSSNETLTSK